MIIVLLKRSDKFLPFPEMFTPPRQIHQGLVGLFGHVTKDNTHWCCQLQLMTLDQALHSLLSTRAKIKNTHVKISRVLVSENRIHFEFRKSESFPLQKSNISNDNHFDLGQYDKEFTYINCKLLWIHSQSTILSHSLICMYLLQLKKATLSHFWCIRNSQREGIKK